MRPQPHDVAELMKRRPDVQTDDGSAAFWFGDAFDGGITWVGKYSTASPWERHPGDEYLYVVDGTVRVVLLTGVGQEETALEQGSFFVVPKGVWHKQVPVGTVVQIGATPGETEHSDLPDPRDRKSPQQW